MQKKLFFMQTNLGDIQKFIQLFNVLQKLDFVIACTYPRKANKGNESAHFHVTPSCHMILIFHIVKSDYYAQAISYRVS